jgi:thymidylate kinase/DNA-binding XRE family transcriptional regulator
MGRAKKTDTDDAVNTAIGARLAGLRRDRKLQLDHVADRLGISVAHLNALEAGRYSFSAAMVLKLAAVFGVAPGALLGPDPPDDLPTQEWKRLFDALARRDRVVLLDLARRLASWSDTFALQTARRTPREQGRLISLEGIDGALLYELGQRLAERMRPHADVVHCWYDYESDLWRYMMSRFDQLEGSPHQIFERTLLYACERLHRQEAGIRPMLSQNKVVVAPFFTMAPGVYQEMEGVGDRRVIDIVEALLLQPDRIIVVQSDPEVAARRAVRNPPGRGEFYSPYGAVEFQRAQALYGKAIEEFTARGYDVDVVKVRDATLSDEIVEHVHRMATLAAPAAHA